MASIMIVVIVECGRLNNQMLPITFMSIFVNVHIK